MTKSQSDEQLKELFDNLDKNKDGKIEFQELKEYFSALNSQQESNNKFVSLKADQNQAKQLFDNFGNDFTFRDFVDYVNQRDSKIAIIFKDLDKNKDGVIDKHEVEAGFEKLGIVLNDSQIDQLLKHLDKNNSLEIDWKEWRDFFRFAPHDKLEAALRHWRAETFTDYTDSSIPNDYTKKEKQSGLWWRNLVAGGLSGAVSRTCTAPLDRVKIFLQVNIESKLTIVSAIKNMVKEGGVKSLWRGNLINVLKVQIFKISQIK